MSAQTTTISVLDVAACILERSTTPMELTKLHELCARAHAWSLATCNQPLFHEPIVAAASGYRIPALDAAYAAAFESPTTTEGH